MTTVAITFMMTLMTLCLCLCFAMPAQGKKSSSTGHGCDKTLPGRAIKLRARTDAKIDALPSSASQSPGALKGKAEVMDSALAATQCYEEGSKAIDRRDFASAAPLLKRAGEEFGPGSEKLKAECMYFEAGCRLMLGEKTEAARLYRAAWDLFEKYDRKSPYKEIAIEQLCDLTFHRLRAEKQEKLEATATRRSQIMIDRNITLEGHVSNHDSLLKAAIATDKNSVARTVHKCFLQMTCLETAELSSNATNAAWRWTPLMVYGKAAAFSYDFQHFEPVIKIRVNGKHYVVKVALPTMSSGVRKILLVTNKEKVCAIDQGSTEIWLLQMKREADGRMSSFSWKKLLHRKD